MLTDTIRKILNGHSLSETESFEILDNLLNAEFVDTQLSAFLIALSMKGETVDEISGFVRALRKNMIKVLPPHSSVVDNSGTGGDMLKTFNISTIASFVLAGAGLCVAKHGNSFVSSLTGSVDLLKILNVHLSETPQKSEEHLKKYGLSFLPVALFHPKTKAILKVRKELKIRTVFNFLGPLCNPAGVSCQMIGVFSKDHMLTMAKVLRKNASKRVLLVRGEDGLDEISLTTSTHMVELFEDGRIEEREFHPQSLGLSLCTLEQLRGGTPEFNAKIALRILKGEDRSPRRTAVCLNAAFLLQMSGKSSNITEALKLAEDSLDSGKALEKLENLSTKLPLP